MRRWLRVLACVVMLSSILISPVSLSPVYALDVPVLIAPIDGSTTTVVDSPPLGIPEFKWGSVTGATKYRLQVSGDIAFTSTIINITTPNTTYTPTNSVSFSDVVWYWRVRVEEPSPVGSYSTIWMFTKQWATPANSPGLISPDNGSTIDFYDDPVFSWDPVTGAARYKLQIYSSPGGWSTLDYSATILATTHQPKDKLTRGLYYWRVLPVDPNNRDGTPSEERSFNASYNYVPTLLEPDNFANPTFTPTFRWTAVRGARYYHLQYSTDPTFGSFTNIYTRNTTYTPTSTMPNDVNYYWRVQTYSGNSISDWSPSRSFIKRWYIRPVLLAPTNLYQHQRFPIFSWTPVPGARNYLVEISTEPGFSPLCDSGYTANTIFNPRDTRCSNGLYYWRVTPYDGNGRVGVTSDNQSYVSYKDSVAPHQVYPLYYYLPDNYPGFPGVETHPHEDRTVALPIFIWHRIFVPALDPNEGEVYAEAYRLQVDDDPLFGSVDWSVDTENLVAAPTSGNSFTPFPDRDYYWRVIPLNGGIEDGEWSQVWKTRIDLSQGLTPTTGTAPELIRPADGFEFAETTPLLEWFPLSGATSYEVEISTDESFSTTVNTATVPYPAYAPTQSLAQRSLGDLDFGTYYWRVHEPGGDWSEIRRFQIAAQSRWQYTRTIGDANNQLQIGSDPASDVGSDYDLTNLQAAQSGSYWYFGFHVPSSPSLDVTYALYLDLDHVDDSGADSDARNYTVTAIPAHQPEYAIYVFQESGNFDPSKVYLYQWTGSNWGTVNVLNSIGGAVASGKMYWTDSGDQMVQRANIEGSNIEDLVTSTDGLSEPTGIALDVDAEKMYWTDYGTDMIQRANFDGSIIEDLVTGLDTPRGIALDVAGGKMYWTDSGTGKIQRANLDGSSVEDLITGVGSPRGIALDLSAGKMYWCEDTSNKIQRANLDGSNIEDLVTTGLNTPRGIALDVAGGKMYWTDSGTGKIQRANLDGSSVEDLITGMGSPRGIALDLSAGKMYWCEDTSNKIQRANLNGSNIEDLVTAGLDIPQGIALDKRDYVEIEVPNTAIGYGVTTGSYSISLFSLPASSPGQPQDSVPSDPNVPGTGPISRFANVTERMNLAMPPNDAGVDPTTYPSILPFFWDWPVLAPWSGAAMEAHLDQAFTSKVAEYSLGSSDVYWVNTSHAWDDDFQGDNTYYWRIQPRYRVGGNTYLGTWSQGWRFERQGFIPENLQTSVTFATPTFSWDMVEGAESYDLQVDDDPGFGSTAINVNTRQNSYTHAATLANATYNWRVRVRRNGGVINDWTSAQTFTLSLPIPADLNHKPPGVVGRAPTLCWTPLIVSSGGYPVLAAWKYSVQVSKEPTFSSIFDEIDTEQSCWTPTKGYDDGEYYWHVAMIDGDGKLGEYSSYQTFTKQYPATTLVSPTTGDTISSTPTFVWTPVDGAARYKLEVSLYPTFSPTYESITTNNTRYTPTKIYPDDTYYWRVAIIDADNKMGPFNNATIILTEYPYKIYLPLVLREYP
jgi:sugar lactone lactonase YvrE